MTAAPLQDTRFRLSESQARELAETYGTPLYVVDEAHFRQRIQTYYEGFRTASPTGELSFATKANSTVALIKIAYQEGCSIDVASEGELRAALMAGVPASACHLHGNNKQPSEIAFAIEQGIGMIVVDNFEEIEFLGKGGMRESGTRVVVRLAPGVDPVTHAKISTGQADTKFGFNIVDGSAEKATVRCLELGLPLIGYHCHVGSQLLDPEAQISGGELIAKFAADMKAKHGFETTYLNVGGGLGVRYTDGDIPMSHAEYCREIVAAIHRALEGTGLNPKLAQEPGRSLIGESGVTLYRVGSVKTVPAKEIGTRTYVSVDGGLSDNPRPALYGSKYTVERVSGMGSLPMRPPSSLLGDQTGSQSQAGSQSQNQDGFGTHRQDAYATGGMDILSMRPSGILPEEQVGSQSQASGQSQNQDGFGTHRQDAYATGGSHDLAGHGTHEQAAHATFTISGKHCETDKLFGDVSLPADLQAGDLLQVLVTGAYNSSMASNYNRYPRPATALLRADGSHTLIQRRDTWDEMLAREILPEGLG